MELKARSPPRPPGGRKHRNPFNGIERHGGSESGSAWLKAPMNPFNGIERLAEALDLYAMSKQNPFNGIERLELLTLTVSKV